jgi:hypothetical protein
MKTISVTVSSEDYEVFRQVASSEGRSIAQLIREAMAYYRAEKLRRSTRLTKLPVLAGHRALGPLPSRADVYDEILGE